MSIIISTFVETFWHNVYIPSFHAKKACAQQQKIHCNLSIFKELITVEYLVLSIRFILYYADLIVFSNASTSARVARLSEKALALPVHTP